MGNWGLIKKVKFTKNANSDYLNWKKQNKKIFKKINLLIKETLEEPYEGLGKPEQLRFELSGFWSRRIDREHRLVYRVEDDCLIIISCKYHYK
jgi:toxin YoeB